MAEPVSIFAFLNSAVKFSEVALKLCAVGSENGVFVRLILRVRNDLQEVERLISTPSVKKKLISTPGKLPYIKNVVFSTKSALNEIGRWVERVRSDKEGHGSISFENRVRWVFNDHDKLTNRTLELSTSHQSLSNVLQYLMPLERDDGPQINNDWEPSPPTYDDATYLDEIMPLSSRQRRQVQYRKSQLDLRGSKEEGPREVFQQTAQHQTLLSPTSQTSFEEQCSSPSNNSASKDSKLRQAKSSISLAQSYQETSHITPGASFYNPSTASFLSQYWENDSSGTFKSPLYVPRRPLSGHSTVSSMSTLNYRETYDTPNPNPGQGNLPATSLSSPQWSLSPDQLSPRTPAVCIAESQDPLRPQISGTNSIGPINAYDMFLEMENPSKPHKDSLYLPTEQFLQVKTQSQAKDVSEMMGDFSLGRREKREYFAELPGANHSTNGNLNHENYNSNLSSKEELSADCPEVPSNDITKPTIAPIELPYNGIASRSTTKAQPPSDTGQQPAFASSAPPSRLQGLDQASQNQFQHPTNPQLQPQNNQFGITTYTPYAVQHPQGQPTTPYQPYQRKVQSQTQYQQYHPPLQYQPTSTRELSHNLPSPVNRYAYRPSPIPLSEPHHQTLEIPKEPWEPTAAGNSHEQHNSLSRSETLSETRRRNQKALLGLLR